MIDDGKINTSGGAGVQGNADPQNDFIGRDRNGQNVTVNNFTKETYAEEHDEPKTLQEAVQWLRWEVYGNQHLRMRGLRNQISDLQRQAELQQAIIFGMGCIILAMAMGLLRVYWPF